MLNLHSHWVKLNTSHAESSNKTRRETKKNALNKSSVSCKIIAPLIHAALFFPAFFLSTRNLSQDSIWIIESVKFSHLLPTFRRFVGITNHVIVNLNRRVRMNSVDNMFSGIYQFFFHFYEYRFERSIRSRIRLSYADCFALRNICLPVVIYVAFFVMLSQSDQSFENSKSACEYHSFALIRDD